jgi:hypothetical protein
MGALERRHLFPVVALLTHLAAVQAAIIIAALMLELPLLAAVETEAKQPMALRQPLIQEAAVEVVATTMAHPQLAAMAAQVLSSSRSTSHENLSTYGH